MGAKGNGDTKGFFGLRAFGVLADQACLDRLDDHASGLLNRIHQARDNRCAVLLAGICHCAPYTEP
jgi:hypothetical protein